MPDPVTALVVGGTSLAGSAISAKASKKAGEIQAGAAESGIEETRAAREELRRLLQPYADVGQPALRAQLDLLGLGPSETDWGAYARSNPAIMQAFEAQSNQPAISFGGFRGFGQYGEPIYDEAYGTQFQMQPKSLEEFAQDYYYSQGMAGGDDIRNFTVTPQQRQQQAIGAIEQSPMFRSMVEQGENAILQNASATGGLRGGNTQAALAQFRPEILNRLITQQYERLGGMTALGQQSAAGVGTSGMTSASSIAELLGQAGAAQAGAKLGAAQAWNNTLMLPAQFAGIQYGRTGKGF